MPALGCSSLPDHQELALLKVLCSASRFVKFSQVCDSNTSLYGSRGSDHRITIQQRRRYLLKLAKEKPHKFLAILQKYNLSAPSDTADIPHFDADNSDSDTVDSSGSTNLPPQRHIPPLLPTRQPPPLRPAMADFVKPKNNSSPQHETIAIENDIEFQEPASHPEGIIPLLVEKAKAADDAFVVCKVLFILLIQDIRDLMNKKYWAELTKDRRAVDFFMPAAAHAFTDEENMKNFLNGECPNTIQTMDIKANELFDQKGGVKRVRLTMPDPLVLNNKEFNQNRTDKSNLGLEMHITWQDIKAKVYGQTLKQRFYMVYWSAAVDGTYKRQKKQAEIDEDQALRELAKKLAGINVAANLSPTNNTPQSSSTTATTVPMALEQTALQASARTSLVVFTKPTDNGKGKSPNVSPLHKTTKSKSSKEELLKRGRERRAAAVARAAEHNATKQAPAMIEEGWSDDLDCLLNETASSMQQTLEEGNEILMNIDDSRRVGKRTSNEITKA